MDGESRRLVTKLRLHRKLLGFPQIIPSLERLWNQDMLRRVGLLKSPLLSLALQLGVPSCVRFLSFRQAANVHFLAAVKQQIGL